MSTKSSVEDLLGESWVDIANASPNTSPPPPSNVSLGGTVTPVSTVNPNPAFSYEEYLRLLKEAQKESNQSSAIVSLASSQRNSPRSSPKSPPNSPVQSASANLEWQSYYLNRELRESDPEQDQWDEWSSRPDQLPPKQFYFKHVEIKPRDLSFRYARMGGMSVFSRKGLCTLLLTNLLSLLLGTGVGLWLSKHGLFIPAVKVR